MVGVKIEIANPWGKLVHILLRLLQATIINICPEIKKKFCDFIMKIVEAI